MATKDELAARRQWAEQLRVIATWVSGPRILKVQNLADLVDPDFDDAPAEEDPEEPEPDEQV